MHRRGLRDIVDLGAQKACHFGDVLSECLCRHRGELASEDLLEGVLEWHAGARDREREVGNSEWR